MIKNIHIIGSLKTGGVEKVIETLFSTNVYSNHFFLVLDKKIIMILAYREIQKLNIVMEKYLILLLLF